MIDATSGLGALASPRRRSRGAAARRDLVERYALGLTNAPGSYDEPSLGRDCGRASTATREKHVMGMITTSDGVEIFFKDWGSGQPIVFSHRWPPPSDHWGSPI